MEEHGRPLHVGCACGPPERDQHADAGADDHDENAHRGSQAFAERFQMLTASDKDAREGANEQCQHGAGQEPEGSVCDDGQHVEGYLSSGVVSGHCASSSLLVGALLQCCPLVAKPDGAVEQPGLLRVDSEVADALKLQHLARISVGQRWLALALLEQLA